MLREPALDPSHRPPRTARPGVSAFSARPAGRVRRALAAAVALGGLWVVASPAGAAPGDGAPGGIDVVQIQGLLDPANASLLKGAVRDAEEAGSTLLVLQIDSGGALDTDVDDLIDAVADSRVPVAAWVGPSGASAKGAAALVAAAADVLVVAQGTGIGPAAPVLLDDPGAWSRERVTERLKDLQEAAGRDGSSAGRITGGRVGAGDAVDGGAADLAAPTVGELIVTLDGREIATPSGTVELSTAEEVGEGRQTRRQPNQEVRFARLDIGGQVSHTLATPWVAYLLFVAGATLIVFEFFSLGVGLAGIVGAVAMAMSFAGFSHLPVHAWALALIAVGVVGFSIDLQAGGFGFWTVAGAVALVAGSFTLYGGAGRLDPVWWIPALVCGSFVALMLTGMTGMVRARFSTPTIGREAMIGETGAAEVDVDPDGVVRVRGALWKAHTHRATPIRAGSPVRVAAVEGLVLEVEPAPERA